METNVEFKTGSINFNFSPFQHFTKQHITTLFCHKNNFIFRKITLFTTRTKYIYSWVFLRNSLLTNNIGELTGFKL